MNRLLELIRDEVEELEMSIEREESINSFRHINQEEITYLEDRLETRDIEVGELRRSWELWRGNSCNWILREVLFDEEGNPIAHREPVRETVRETGIVKVEQNT